MHLSESSAIHWLNISELNIGKRGFNDFNLWRDISHQLVDRVIAGSSLLLMPVVAKGYRSVEGPILDLPTQASHAVDYRPPDVDPRISRYTGASLSFLRPKSATCPGIHAGG
jgi:hypothetical protein